MANDLLRVIGLWENEDRSGETYLAGTLGGVKVLVMKNKRKTESNHPDWNLLIAPKEQKQQDEGMGSDANDGRRSRTPF